MLVINAIYREQEVEHFIGRQPVWLKSFLFYKRRILEEGAKVAPQVRTNKKNLSLNTQKTKNH